MIFLLIGCLFACKPSTQKQTVADAALKKQILTDSLRISPGKGIGRILLNGDVGNVSKILGRPDSSDAAMGSSLMVWYAGHNASGYETSVFARRNFGAKDEIISRIQKVLVTSPMYKTADHVGVGTTLANIKNSYDIKPTSNYNSKNGKVQVYTDLDKGISFEINEASNKCVGIVVHKPYDTASAYLDMH